MQILSVSQVNAYLRELLETDRYLSDLWVSGEVSNLSRPVSGHVYFTLKDEYSQLRCVLFRRLSFNGADFQAGMKIVAHGRVSIYESSGALQLYVDFVQPEGLGELYLEFQRLRAQLEEEGLFDLTRKRPLPPFPRRIGVVTSPSGAVFHDICQIIARRWPLVEVVLAPTPVQGPEAVVGVCQALKELNEEGRVDLIIVARGGGSLEELAAFNSELVARAIYASRVPVISAVGHETDYTIADDVADLRAPTPSAAAEMAVPDRRELHRQLMVLVEALAAGSVEAVRRRRADLREQVRRLERCLPDLDRWRQMIDERWRRAGLAFDRQIERQRSLVERCTARLTALSPLDTLSRGYAVVQRGATGEVVSRVAQVQPGDRLWVRVQDGRFSVYTPENGRRGRRSAPSEQLAFELDLPPSSDRT